MNYLLLYVLSKFKRKLLLLDLPVAGTSPMLRLKAVFLWKEKVGKRSEVGSLLEGMRKLG